MASVSLVKPGSLGILLQQSLALQAAAYTLTDALNQILQLTFIRCLDTPKAGRSVVVINMDAEPPVQRPCSTPMASR